MDRSEKPRFDKRNVYVGLIIWSLGLLLVASVYVFVAIHPGVPGEKDLGEGVLVVGTIFIAALLFICGVLSMLVGLLHFLWLSWRFNRSSSV
jgi:hypothetical protein